ncbi:transmembrane protein 164 [Trichinella spiralis]|uniref:transmembrane protein 164 n=1 Tax=Trichinella spiralis TaxID=6334 RepID=UPI0001EFC500|nr:transmembrane protein 164 [Trichinella spiralis]
MDLIMGGRPQQRGRRMLSLFNRLPAFGGNRPCAPGCYFTVVLHLAESKEHGSSSCAEFSRLQQLQKIRLIFTFHLDTSVRGGGVLQGANWLFDFPAQPVPCGDHNLLPPSVARLVFALAMYFLPGATLALLFPVVTSRKLPGEVCIYWIQHLIIVLCPVYLLSLGGVYSAESFYNFNIYVLCHALMTLYSFGPLQLISMLTNVNLNNVLCPASSDPFQGYYYRLAAIGHHSLFLILHSWLYIKFTRMILAAFENGSFIPTQLVEANGNKIHPPRLEDCPNCLHEMKKEN